jgi:hypothetical protein
MKVNYIPVFYFGQRRINNLQDKHYFLKKHLDFLQSLDSDSPIHATLVINVSSTHDEVDVKQIISEYTLNIPVETMFRENSGYSYGGWNHALMLNIFNQYDYSFLIEDDYVPSRKDFYTPFINQVKEDTSFVCTKLFLSPLHAAISNGLLPGNNAKKVFEVYGRVFDVNSGDSYGHAEMSQVNFLSLFDSLGLKLTELSEEFEKPFLNFNSEIITYGGQIKAPIEPIRAE